MFAEDAHRNAHLMTVTHYTEALKLIETIDKPSFSYLTCCYDSWKLI